MTDRQKQQRRADQLAALVNRKQSTLCSVSMEEILSFKSDGSSYTLHLFSLHYVIK